MPTVRSHSTWAPGWRGRKQRECNVAKCVRGVGPLRRARRAVRVVRAARLALGYRALETYGAANQISALVGLGLYRELAPVLTALLFIGRAGSSIAAELGLMRATDQITALGLMAVDPVERAVAPRFWAAVITMPLLTGFFCSLGITASYFEAVHVIGIDAGTYWQVLKDAVDFRDDFLVAFQKSAVFGGVAALVTWWVGRRLASGRYSLHRSSASR